MARDSRPATIPSDLESGRAEGALRKLSEILRRARVGDGNDTHATDLIEFSVEHKIPTLEIWKAIHKGIVEPMRDPEFGRPSSSKER